MTQILVFGTSTTYGCWDIEGGWVQRLRKYLDEKQIKNPGLYYIVYNLGISGDTTKDILERIEFEAKQRLKLLDKGEEVIFLIHAGVNDAIINNETKQFHVPLKDYEKNIEKIIQISRRIGNKTIFIGNKPANEKLVDPIPWLPGYSYLNKYIEQYENKSKEVCLKNKVHFIDVFNDVEVFNKPRTQVRGTLRAQEICSQRQISVQQNLPILLASKSPEQNTQGLFDFKDKNYGDLHPDGVHLNSKGHEKMFEIVRDYLVKNKII